MMQELVLESQNLQHQLITHRRLPMKTTYTNLEERQDKSFGQIHIQKIVEYYRRQSRRTDTEKVADFEELKEEQLKWIKTRMGGPTLTWEVWNAG